MCQVVDGVEQSAAAHRYQCIVAVSKVADGQQGIGVIVCLHQLAIGIIKRTHHRCIASLGKRGLNLAQLHNTECSLSLLFSNGSLSFYWHEGIRAAGGLQTQHVAILNLLQQYDLRILHIEQADGFLARNII